MRNTLYSPQQEQALQNELYPKVLFTVAKAKKSLQLKVFIAWSLLSLAFSPVTFFLLLSLHRKLIESSTYEYVSLFLNDAEARSLYAKDILFAVYDTIPLTGALVTLFSLVMVTLFYYKTVQLLTSFKRLSLY
jgi:hypothetical protein